MQLNESANITFKNSIFLFVKKYRMLPTKKSGITCPKATKKVWWNINFKVCLSGKEIYFLEEQV